MDIRSKVISTKTTNHKAIDDAAQFTKDWHDATPEEKQTWAPLALTDNEFKAAFRFLNPEIQNEINTLNGATPATPNQGAPVAAPAPAPAPQAGSGTPAVSAVIQPSTPGNVTSVAPLDATFRYADVDGTWAKVSSSVLGFVWLHGKTGDSVMASNDFDQNYGFGNEAKFRKELGGKKSSGRTGGILKAFAPNGN